MPTDQQPGRRRTLEEIKAGPATVPIPVAARDLGISSAHAYELLKRDAFPCAVIRAGLRYVVKTSSLVRLLEDHEQTTDTP